MRGMDQRTGRAIAGVSHLRQSIGRILSTPIGSRVARRWFGSDLASLIDAPNNGRTKVQLYAAAAGALMRHEPRLKLTRLSLQQDTSQPGRVVLDIQGIAKNSGQVVTATVPLTQGA
jgi:uncharacterized protein